jgi:membrane protein
MLANDTRSAALAGRCGCNAWGREMDSRGQVERLNRQLVEATSNSPDRDPGTQDKGAAATPVDVPAQGWKDIIKQAWNDISERNIFLIAGGVTYATLLALFPALAALVAIYGLAMDPGQIEKQISALTGLLPQESTRLLSDELHQLVAASQGKLGIAAVLGMVFAIWSASRGMSGMITALDIAYGAPERRGFFKFNLVAVVLTLGTLISGLFIVALVAVLPAFVQILGVGSTTKWLVLALEWPLLIVFVMFGLAVLYRFAPDRPEPKWRWVTPGAIAATALWILGSLAFSVYVANFGSYDATYGSLGAVVVLLTWMYLSAFVVLLGAVINGNAEQHTAQPAAEGQSEARPVAARALAAE